MPNKLYSLSLSLGISLETSAVPTIAFFRESASRARPTAKKDARQKEAEINGPEESGRFVASGPRHGFTLHLTDAGLASRRIREKRAAGVRD